MALDCGHGFHGIDTDNRTWTTAYGQRTLRKYIICELMLFLATGGN